MQRIPKTSERKDSGVLKKALSRTAMLTLEVLKQVSRDAEFFYVATTGKNYHPVGFAAAKRIMSANEWRELRHQHHRMRTLRIIEQQREDGRLVDVLTEKGEQMLLKLRLKVAPRREDGALTCVSYDIPETA